MKCENCGKEMQEEILFTSVNYKCNCDDGWNTVTDIKRLLLLEDYPLKMKYIDSEDGPEIIVFVGDPNYFDRCPPNRKFKILYKCPEGFVGYKGMSELEFAEQLYGYSIVNKGENNE